MVANGCTVAFSVRLRGELARCTGLLSFTWYRTRQTFRPFMHTVALRRHRPDTRTQDT